MKMTLSQPENIPWAVMLDGLRHESSRNLRLIQVHQV